MERNDLIPQPPFAGADPVAIGHDRKLRRLPADADTYVSAIGEPAFVARAPGCRVLGDAVVLRIRRAFRSQQYERRRTCLWLIRRRKRNLSDFGAKPTLHWAITDSRGIYGANHCSPKRVADLNCRTGSQFKAAGHYERAACSGLLSISTSAELTSKCCADVRIRIRAGISAADEYRIGVIARAIADVRARGRCSVTSGRRRTVVTASSHRCRRRDGGCAGKQ
jgi:hypothetical protein